MQSRIVVDIDFGSHDRHSVLDLETDLEKSKLWNDALSIHDDSEGLVGRHVYITLPQSELTQEQHQWLNNWSNGDGGIVHYDVIPVPHTLTIGHYLSSRHPGWQAYYKDCLIDTITSISKKYVHIVLQLPRPVGGTVEEVVSVETVIEYKEQI